MRHVRFRAGACMPQVLTLAMLPALAGCTIPKAVNPVEIYRTVTGAVDEGRPPPPGLDRGRPNLASVPPRPERPPPEVRDAISAALVANREQSRAALAPRAVPARPGQAAPGDPAIPASPPARASLAGAPAIPWSDTAPRARPPQGGGPAAAPEPAPPAIPDLAPAPPPPDLLGPPPRPELRP
ncbi:hypothetical protein SAMN02927895_00062 [Belnapia rosea]|nr:hypothetical protein SAMN02927895_00062 [Belnapia rosea]